jgi:putative ABC transport system permease protein
MPNSKIMIKNYLKVAWRNLLRNKGLATINILGLSFGMAFAILIGLWIKYESSFDQFNKNLDRLAYVRKNVFFNNERATQVSVPLPLYKELKTNYPEVKRASRMDWGSDHSLVVGDNRFNEGGFYVDPDFLEMFSYPLLQGNVKTVLNDLNSIVITESLAKTLFRNEDPMGKMIRVDNQYNVKVTGVLKDIPKNSTFEFQFLAPYEFKVQNEKWVKDNLNEWGNNFLMTVLEVNEGVSMSGFSNKLGPLAVAKTNYLKNQAFILQPFSKVHLYDEYKNWANVGGKIEYIRLFGVIGIFVLLIACINFMNLSTARSEKRAREVGIRKAVGSHRWQLIGQFLSESILTTFLAFLVSIGLVQLLLPQLKDIGFEHVKFDFSNTWLLISVLLICIFTGLVSGSYPAFYLSSFAPVKVLKGLFRQGKAPAKFRKVLVVSQFAISIGLIICTVVVFKQIEKARGRSLGYNPADLISVYSSKDLSDNYNIVKQELMQTGVVEAVSKASNPMTGIWNTWSDFNWDGKEPGSDLAMNAVMTEYDFEKTVGMKFVEGRTFSRDYGSDSNSVILNEAALKMINYKNPIGKTMKLGERVLTIIGIVEDMLMENPFKPVNPTAILFSRDNTNILLVKTKKTANIKNAIATIRPIFEKYNPSLPFEYNFVDEDFGKKFTTEKQVGKLAGIFAGLAIFISCLGLFGLAAFMAERRTKEIGIRKVLGASVANLWLLLSKEFVVLVLVACVIASPLAFWLMSGWLEKYDYRISISVWMFVIAGILALLIALVTVSTQAIKAAIANPVKSLRTE